MITTKRYLRFGRWVTIDLRENWFHVRLAGYPRAFCLEVSVHKKESGYYRFWSAHPAPDHRFDWWRRDGFRWCFQSARLHLHVSYLPWLGWRR